MISVYLRVKRRLSPEGDVDNRVPAECRDLSGKGRELFRVHDRAFLRDVPGKDRVGTIGAGVRASLHDLNGEEGGKRTEDPRLFLKDTADRIRVMAAFLHDPLHEEEVALGVGGEPDAQEAQVHGGKLGLDVE